MRPKVAAAWVRTDVELSHTDAHLTGPMHTPSHWARVQLVQGQSGAGMWDLSSQLPEARVTVGAGPSAGWNVQATGVEQEHFELYWDGRALWVSPAHTGQLTIDGERVQAWRQISGRARLEFGSAAFIVESSQSIEVSGTPVPARPSQPPGVLSIEDFVEDDATAVYQEGDAFGLDSSPLEGAATQMVDPSVSARPGLGAGVSGAPRLAAPTVGPMQMDDVTAAPGRRELKTQILDTEALGLPPPSRPPPGPPAPVMGGVGGLPADIRPTLMSSQVSTDVIATPAAEGGFALPPTGAEAEGAKGLRALGELPPKRTLILFGVTLLVAIAGLTMVMLKNKRAAQTAAAAAEAQQAQQSQQAQAIADQMRTRIHADREAITNADQLAATEVVSAIDAAFTAARNAALEEIPDETTDEEVAAIISSAEQRALEELAVQAVMANNTRLALTYYDRLSRDYSSAQYTAMVRVLRAKVECRRGVRRDGTSCD